jgi:hypothetical protein
MAYIVTDHLEVGREVDVPASMVDIITSLVRNPYLSDVLTSDLSSVTIENHRMRFGSRVRDRPKVAKNERLSKLEKHFRPGTTRTLEVIQSSKSSACFQDSS